MRDRQETDLSLVEINERYNGLVGDGLVFSCNEGDTTDWQETGLLINERYSGQAQDGLIIILN